MKPHYKWILIEFITIVFGTFLMSINYLGSRSGDQLAIAIAASMIVLGIMIRLWRKEFLNK